jgi:hypothetical protein
MEDITKPNVAVSLCTIHKVVTRAIDVLIDHAKLYARDGFPDEVVREGFFKYLTAFVSVLQSHHLTEDDLAYPDFRDKLPDAPFELWTKQHEEIFELLSEIHEFICENANEDRVSSSRMGELLGVMLKLREKWHPHIRLEEEHFDKHKVGAMFPVEEQARLISRYSEHSQTHSGPPFLTVPFMLFNLPPEPRKFLMAAMPADLTEHLVPVVWKEKWESMKPFLLL